ncbi:MAG TPA: hypothetical protein VLK33_12770 [Terriglobales bacterium]|nr:hypothetical protein [Terriglobales bacterium]
MIEDREKRKIILEDPKKWNTGNPFLSLLCFCVNSWRLSSSVTLDASVVIKTQGENALDLESVKKAVAAEIEKLTKVYKALGGITRGTASLEPKTRRKMSKEARDKIAAAQRKRWAKQRRAA